MLRCPSARLPAGLRPALLALFALLFLAACDGEPVEYDSERYDIEWTFLGGGTSTGQAGVYGSLGVPSATNQPGARSGAVSWRQRDAETDAEVFWLFGGTGYDGNGNLGPLNDLWQYTEQDGVLMWTWVAGSATVAGATADYGSLGVADPANIPGGRDQALGWVDGDGALWLFGGLGLDTADTNGRLNDLWRYSAGGWTWIGGSDTVNQPGTYGTKGTADANNRPGARYAATGWVDDDGAFWLFAGNGYAEADECCWLNDLWKYQAGQWTWVTGSADVNVPAVYGTTGSFDAANTPGGRYGGAAWHTIDAVTTDTDDLQAGWVFGGTGNNADGDRVVLNELWKFDHESGQWAFQLGTKGDFSAGSYGGRGVFAFTNVPPSRHRPIAWQSGTSTLFLFGGTVETAEGVTSTPNDLWRFDSIAWTWVGGANTGSSPDEYPEAVLGAGQPGGREGGVGWVDDLGSLFLFGGSGHNDLWLIAP